MSTFTLKSASTSSTFINLMFVKRKIDDEGISATLDIEQLNKEDYIIWNSMEHPDWVISMNHSMHGSGHANDIALSLFHRIDPYTNTTHGESFYGSILNRDGVNTDQPSFLLSLINDSYNTIFFQYGYAHDRKSNIDLVTIDDFRTENRTDNSWFRMYITEVGHSFDTNGVTIDITAVSTLVTSENIFGSDATGYDWLVDPENRLVLSGSKEDYVVRLKAILKYFAEHNTIQKFRLDMTDLDKHPLPTLKMKDFMKQSGYTEQIYNLSSETNNIFNQGNKGNHEFIVDILDNLVTCGIVHDIDYYDNGQIKTEKHCFAYYQGWTMLINDKVDRKYGLPTIKITWTTVSYTRKNLDDVYSGKVNLDTMIYQSDINNYNHNYRPFYTDTNNENGPGITSLFYNFPSFNRDIFETMDIQSSNLSEYSEEFLKRFSTDAKVGIDIISLDLANESLIAGVAQMIKEGMVYYTNEDGVDSVIPYEKIITSDGSKNSLEQGVVTSKATNFNRVLHQLFVSGTVTVPGLAKIVNILSNIAIYIYVSNRLDPQSGMYRIIDQTDSINGGQYTTQLLLQKVLSLSGDRSPMMQAEEVVATQNLGVPDITESSIDSISGKLVTSAQINLYKNYNLTTGANTPIKTKVGKIGATKGVHVISDDVIHITQSPTVCFIFNLNNGETKHLTEDYTFYYRLYNMNSGKYIYTGSYNIGTINNLLSVYSNKVHSTNIEVPCSVEYLKTSDNYLYAFIKFSDSVFPTDNIVMVDIVFSIEGKPKISSESLKNSNILGVRFDVKFERPSIVKPSKPYNTTI